MNSIIFWRLQEVEVPLCEGKTFDDLRSALIDIRIGDSDSFFDFEYLFDWNKEEILNEDYSGTDECFAVKNDGKIIEYGGYRMGNCQTHIYVDNGTRNCNKDFIKHLDSVINKKQ